jgi:hypothetical protein
MTRRYYAVEYAYGMRRNRGNRADKVLAFGSKADRDKWVRWGEPDWNASGHRRACTADESYVRAFKAAESRSLLEDDGSARYAP